MTQMKTTQMLIDEYALAERNVQYLSDMLNVLSHDKTKPLMKTFASRISKTIEEYQLRLERSDPEKAVEIAGCQEAISVCREMMDALDYNLCHRKVEEFKKQLDGLKKEIEKRQENSTNPATATLKSLKKKP